MQDVLIQPLAIAAGGLFSFGSILAVIFFLGTERGLLKSVMYLVGYSGIYTVYGIIALKLDQYMIVENGNENSSYMSSVLFIFLGSLMLFFAIRKWRDETNSSPKIMVTLAKMKPLTVLGFGALVATINFKNLAIFLSAISIVVVSQIPMPGRIISVLLVVLVFCSTMFMPVIIFIVFPSRSASILEKIKKGLEQHSQFVSVAMLSVFGLIFLFKGIAPLL